jgi:hypothetical protein
MLSARAERRAIRAARPKLHPTSAPLAYGLAVGGPSPMRTVVVLVIAAVAVAVALSAMTGAIAGPGILFFVTFSAFNPARAVITTTNSVVVMSRSVLHGRPTDVRAVVPVTELLAPAGETSGPWRAYRLGDETVWMTDKHAAKVVEAARRVVPVGAF